MHDTLFEMFPARPARERRGHGPLPQTHRGHGSLPPLRRGHHPRLQSGLLAAFTLVLISLAPPARAALQVFACEPEWAALATAIGGAQVEASSATTGQQNPHFIEARPSLIARMRKADLVVCTGLDLESSWLPQLLQQSGNPRVQPGQPGHFIAGQKVRRLEIPTAVDRAHGDVHPSGNPHIQLDPRNILRVAKALAGRMGELDPAQADGYAKGLQAFSDSWAGAIARWETAAAPLHGTAVVPHHKDMVYLLAWLGMHEVGNLEPKPGLEPSSAHLAELLTRLQHEPAKLVLRTPYQSERASQWLAERAGIRAVTLPSTVGGSEAATDLYTLFDDIVARLLEGIR